MSGVDEAALAESLDRLQAQIDDLAIATRDRLDGLTKRIDKLEAALRGGRIGGVPLTPSPRRP